MERVNGHALSGCYKYVTQVGVLKTLSLLVLHLNPRVLGDVKRDLPVLVSARHLRIDREDVVPVGRCFIRNPIEQHTGERSVDV